MDSSIKMLLRLRSTIPTLAGTPTLFFAKTWHILEYVDDPAFRRRVLVGLNKGETLHSLAREISFGRQGRFMDRGYEAQLNRASALSLVINAIGVWNTRYFEQAQTVLIRQGFTLPGDLESHVTPFQ